MSDKDFEDALVNAISDLNGQRNDDMTKAEAWEKIAEALKDLDKVRVTHGEDNTFSLPYYVKIAKGLSRYSTEENYEKVQWCHKQYGAHWDIDNIRGTWCYDNGGQFNFKHEMDRTLFMLRWAQ